MRAFSKVALLVSCSIGCSASSILAKPLGATIYNAQGQPNAGFAVSVEAEGLKFGLDESGGGSRVVPFAQISKVDLNQPDGWSDAFAAYTDGDYARAETGFAQLSADYASLGMVSDQYPAKARYYLLQCLRANGKFEQLAQVLETTKTTSPIALNAHYSEDVNFLTGWALAGKENWAGVQEFVAQYEDAGAQNGAPRVPFRSDLPQGRIVELAFLRGLSTAKTAGDDPALESAALEDLTRAAVLNFGSDKSLTTQAIDEALSLLVDTPADDEIKRREANALAIVRRDIFGAGLLDAKFMPLLDIKDLPELGGGGGGGGGDDEPAADDAEAGEPAPAEEAPEDGAEAEAPAEEEAAPAE